MSSYFRFLERVKMNVFLLSKPEYAFAIINGTKQHEFRKVMFRRDVDKVVVYATAPYKRIIGYFKVGHIHQGSPQTLWNQFSAHGGIDKKAFFSYFKSRSSGIAIEVKRPVSFLQHKKPQEILSGFTMPNSFKYLSENEFKLIKRASS